MKLAMRFVGWNAYITVANENILSKFFSTFFSEKMEVQRRGFSKR